MVVPDHGSNSVADVLLNAEVSAVCHAYSLRQGILFIDTPVRLVAGQGTGLGSEDPLI